jgi:hypothetical protein
MPRLEHMAAEMSLDDLVAALRAVEELRLAGGRGNFHFKGRPFLHFHDGPDGPYADVRDGTRWEEFAAATPTERQALLAFVVDRVEELSRCRPNGTREHPTDHLRNFSDRQWEGCAIGGTATPVIRPRAWRRC